MPGKHLPRSFGWCFTLNNYTEEEYQRCIDVQCRYIVIGKEIGESGTPHLQGYVHYSTNVPMSRVKKDLSTRAHVERRFGTVSEAANYCKKDGNFFENGDMPRDQKQTWKDVMELAQAGKMEQIMEDYPAIYILHRPKLEALNKTPPALLDRDLKSHFEWWYGPTGTGKSHQIWTQYPIHYDKQINKWWDGYDREDVVVIEEADPKKCEHMAYFFKRWMDRYPFQAEIKGAVLSQIRPKKIIITSNYTLQECFPCKEDYEPLKRRIKEVHFAFQFRQPAIPIPTIPEENPLFLADEPEDCLEFLSNLDNLSDL
nr:MAG: replication associated protein [Cressdnaviricota sp.]